MKSTLTSLLGTLSVASLLLAATPVLAQNSKPPTQLTYQGFLTDGSGVPFGNTAPVNKTVLFRIWDASTGGNLKWSSQQVVTVDKGYFSVLLGQGSQNGTEPFSADLSGVFTGSSSVSDRYLELTADGTTILPRIRFFAAPYAMLAKSATELVDPTSGTSAFSISGGNISGNGNLSANTLSATNLSVTGGITAGGNIGSSGAVSAASVTATGAITAGGLATGVGVLSTGNLQAHPQGAYLEWNKENTGMSYLLNQKGNAAGGLVLGEVSTANAITERVRIDSTGQVGIGTSTPAAKLDVNGTLKAGAATLDSVTANSFKISGTPTLVLTGLTRFSLLNNAPMTGVNQSATINAGQGRTPSVPADWYKSTQTSYATLYAGTFTVPSGETWEVFFSGTAQWNTDDYASLTWTVDDVALDDPSLQNHPTGVTASVQTVILTGGATYTVRVKAAVGNGSGSDAIYFPTLGGPNFAVVRKYKVN